MGRSPVLQGDWWSRLERKRRAPALGDRLEALMPEVKRMRTSSLLEKALACAAVPVSPASAARAPLALQLAQARLRREAEEPGLLPAQARWSVDPDCLRAVLTLAARPGAGPSREAAPEDLQLEFSFPPDYPFRPPSLLRACPEQGLASGQDGRHAVLPILEEQRWSFAMGLADVAWDLARALQGPGAGAGAAAAVAACAAAVGSSADCAPGLGDCRAAESLAAPPDDVDMA